MCQLLNTLPKVSKFPRGNGDYGKKNNLELFIFPSDEKQYYRVRLIAFTATKKSSRIDPFIERFVHQHWTTDENGKHRIDDSVVCPSTKFVKWDGDKQNACPICKFVMSNLGTLKNTNWKDAMAKQNYNANKKIFQGIIPVYVVNDPNNEKNNGKMKVIIIRDKKKYEEIRGYISTQSESMNVFNGGEAVDFYFRMAPKETVYGEGTENERKFTKNEIVRYGFTNKPYSIEQINRDTLESFEYDETYFVSPTPEELDAYYSNNVVPTVSNDDIPDYDEPAKTNVAKTVLTSKPKTKKEKEPDISTEELNDLLGESESGKKVEDSFSDDFDLDDVDDLIDKCVNQ